MRLQAEQPQRKELQRTMHPNGASQTQNNIEVRRCRAMRSQLPTTINTNEEERHVQFQKTNCLAENAIMLRSR